MAIKEASKVETTPISSTPARQAAPLTPKKVIVGLLLVIAFVILYSGFRDSMFPRTMMHANTVTESFAGSGGVAIAPTMTSGAVSMMRVVGKASLMDGAPSADLEVGAPIPPGDAGMIAVSSAPAGDAKIVRSGNLSLLVKNVNDAAQAIADVRISMNGQEGNENFSQYGGVRRGDITIWVPSDRFDEAVATIKKLALRVDNESVNVQDVSAQYVDLQSRLKNLKAAEEQYLVILKQSGKISDVLDVTRALNDTRAQIEQTQGQMDYLSRQTALSSITISLTEEDVPGTVVTNEWRPITVIKAAMRQTLSDLTDFINMILVFLVRLPVLILNIGFWVLIVWVLYRIARKLYRHMMRVGHGSGGASTPLP